jgi:hypothetical protein
VSILSSTSLSSPVFFFNALIIFYIWRPGGNFIAFIFGGINVLGRNAFWKADRTLDMYILFMTSVRIIMNGEARKAVAKDIPAIIPPDTLLV